MLNVGPNLCLTDVQVYVLAVETLSKKSPRDERNKEAVKVLLMSISMLIEEYDNKLFVLFEFSRLLQAYVRAYI